MKTTETILQVDLLLILFLSSDRMTLLVLRNQPLPIHYVCLWLDRVRVSHEFRSLMVVRLTIGVATLTILFQVSRLAPRCMLCDAEDEDAAECLTKVDDIAQSNGLLDCVVRRAVVEGPCRENDEDNDPEHHSQGQSDRPSDQVLVQVHVSDMNTCALWVNLLRLPFWPFARTR